MALPVSGVISASMINVEIGRSSGASFNMNGSQERELAGRPSGSISFSHFHGKSWVVPGTSNYTSVGSYTWVCPKYNSITIRVWGGGASGKELILDGANGSQSKFHTTLTSGGGIGGVLKNGGAGGSTSGGASGSSVGGAGGASSGSNGGRGGHAPSGGTGGAGGTSTTSGKNGNAPGGGGGGGATSVGDGGGGGGSGGYTTRTYNLGDSGAPVPGNSYSVVVGAGGASSGNNGAGATGRVTITWS